MNRLNLVAALAFFGAAIMWGFYLWWINANFPERECHDNICIEETEAQVAPKKKVDDDAVMWMLNL